MTERIVRPVRAWADYDEWLGYLEYRHQWLEWTWAEVPKGAAGDLYSDTNEVNSVVEAVQAWGGERGFGALRSLRVLYDNGYELHLWPAINGLEVLAWWHWALVEDEAKWGPAFTDGAAAAGSWERDPDNPKDSEAVERAMIAAAAWFSQR